MNKLLAIIRREYLERVRSKLFLVATLLGPVIMVAFAVVPGLIFSIKTGGPTRVAVVDQTGVLAERVRESILRSDGEKAAETSPE
ncbi:MAG TPA: hypothetical protein VM870_08560, partial [Pyrinomonadaceae bacterium]|nr:hypothetical protein [Pyrinomonadaceae bacterium]